MIVIAVVVSRNAILLSRFGGHDHLEFLENLQLVRSEKIGTFKPVLNSQMDCAFLQVPQKL